MSLHKPSVPWSERLKAIPGFFGIRLSEEPHYQVIERHDPFEIRQYPSLVLASTNVHADYDVSKGEAFTRLFEYIAGKNEMGERLAMTVPVFQQDQNMIRDKVTPEKILEDWSMSFILPKGIDLDTAPEPEDSLIHLSTKPAQKWAVLRYVGSPDELLMMEKVVELKRWLEKKASF